MEEERGMEGVNEEGKGSGREREVKERGRKVESERGEKVRGILKACSLGLNHFH